MGGILGGPGGSSSNFPSWTAPFTRYAFTGMTPGEGHGGPPDQGLIGDAYWGGQAAPSQDIFGGLMGQVPNAQLGGQQIRGLAAQAGQQGYGNAMTIAGNALGPLQHMYGLGDLVPGGLDASNYYMGQVTRGIQQGLGGGGTTGVQHAATSRVTDAALGQLQNAGIDGDLYNRAADLLRPQVRAATSARGLGTSGISAGLENESMQQLADSFAQKAMQNRIGLLGTAASAAGAEGSERVGLTDAMIRQSLGRGSLANDAGRLSLAASMGIPSILQGFGDVYQQPLDASQTAMGLQSGPLALTGLTGQVYNQGLQMPLDYQQALYNFTRSPALSLLSGLSGTQLQNSDYRGIFGVPK